jgi:hypothetical protein
LAGHNISYLAVFLVGGDEVESNSQYFECSWIGYSYRLNLRNSECPWSIQNAFQLQESEYFFRDFNFLSCFLWFLEGYELYVLFINTVFMSQVLDLFRKESELHKF